MKILVIFTFAVLSQAQFDLCIFNSNTIALIVEKITGNTKFVESYVLKMEDSLDADWIEVRLRRAPKLV